MEICPCSIACHDKEEASEIVYMEHALYRRLCNIPAGISPWIMIKLNVIEILIEIRRNKYVQRDYRFNYYFDINIIYFSNIQLY